MRWLLLIPILFAQDTGDPHPPPSVEPPAARSDTKMQVQAQMEEVQDLSASIEAMKAFLRDEIMREDGFAPPGWETPGLEVYEATPGRPSFLPLENVMSATSAGKAEPGLLAAYTTWLTAEAAKQPE